MILILGTECLIVTIITFIVAPYSSRIAITNKNPKLPFSLILLTLHVIHCTNLNKEKCLQTLFVRISSSCLINISLSFDYTPVKSCRELLKNFKTQFNFLLLCFTHFIHVTIMSNGCVQNIHTKYYVFFI